jgi:3-hydroxyacyl-CoA dehydrogenase/enoyl-CoA hydratase/3-hydroxybutyryl-CoA epimerase
MTVNPAGNAWRAERSPAGDWTLWFDRPGSSQNSLDSTTLQELGNLLKPIETDRSAKRVIVRSNKPKGFCAGADLKQLQAFQTVDEVIAFGRLGQETLARLARLSVPTVAVVHGVCVGGGLELALSCLQILAVVGDHDVKLGTPEVRLGLVPAWGALSALPPKVGLRPALRMLLSGEPVGSDQASNMGLIDGVLRASRLEEDLEQPRRLIHPTLATWPPPGWQETLAEARATLGASDRTTARTRLLDLLETELKRGPDDAREAQSRALAELLFSPEAKAALAAFFARRAGRS